MKTNHPSKFFLLIAFVTAYFFASSPLRAEISYEEPRMLTGRIFEGGAGTNKLLFTSKRTSTGSNGMVNVRCEYFNPSGSLVAVESLSYEHGNLASFQLDELQTGCRGTVSIKSEPATGSKKKVLFEWSKTGSGKPKTKTGSETTQAEVLIGDMIPFDISKHWNTLIRGEPLEFRLIVPARLETVGFRLVKEAEVTCNGKKAVRLRMEASNFFISKLVDPLFFIVEKDAPHRFFEYSGRVTPMQREGDKWKDLDARSVYDW